MLDVFPDLFGDKISGVALDRGSSGGDQELFKIPRDVGSFDGRPSDEERICHQRIRVVVRGWESTFQPFKDGMSSFAVDQTFLHEHQLGLIAVAWTHVLQVLQDLITVAVFLVTKLITGKSQDNELLAKLVGECVHLGVIPGGRASQGGDVLDEDGFAFEHVHLQLGSGKTAAGESLSRQVIKGLEGGACKAHHD